MHNENNHILAGYQPAPLENWYRHNYFNNDYDISGSGVEDYTFAEAKKLANFDFNEIEHQHIKDGTTIGGSELRQLIADNFGTGDAKSVVTTNGANEGLNLIVRAILNPGDEIITLGPCYHCHDKIALSMGCTVKKWKMQLDNDIEFDLNSLEQLITPNTKAVFLNFPHNPSGVTISQAMLDKIVDLLRDKDLLLVWDAVFQQLHYEQGPLKDPIHYYEKTITLGTFSKAFGAPGLRFGWVIASDEVVAAMVRQKDYGNLYVAPIIEFTAEKILRNLKAFTEPRLEQSAQNRTITDQWMLNQKALVSWKKPTGGVCGLMKLPSHVDDVDFCKALLSEHRVLLVPGSCFEMPGYVRLGFGGNTSHLKEGLLRLEKHLASYRISQTEQRTA